MIDFTLYKNTIIAASKSARQASSIDAALEIQAQGYATALQVALLSAAGVTTVATSGSPTTHTGTGNLVGGIT